MNMREREGLIVRPLAPSDTEALFNAVRQSIDQLSYWMPWCTPSYSMQEAASWVSHCLQAWEHRSELPLGIFEASTGTLVGATGINQVNALYRIGNLGYWVATQFAGRGIARNAARMAAEIGFSELGLTRLEIVVLTHNRASQRVAEGLGARRECSARNRLYFQGAPHEAIVYSLVPGDMVAMAVTSR